jgi:hypothetical protein
MTATDELRRMLDERGVERYDGTENTLWGYEDYNEFTGIYRFSADETRDGYMQVRLWHATPEQAIAATLGRRTCKLHDCEGSFSAVNRPVWRCDCGAFMTQYTDATTYHKPRFCPNCGRRVMNE